MDEWTTWRMADRCAAIGPQVRATCDAIAERYDLAWQDRDDLEQELWLALLSQWSDRDHRMRTKPIDDLQTLARRLGLLMATAFDGEDARNALCDSVDTPTSHLSAMDLRLDVAALLARLSADERGCCHQLMADADEAPLFAGVAALDPARLAALRSTFEAHGLCAYL